MSLQPLVTCAIPVYNGAAFLAEAIQSILDQTYTNIELIIINDGSSDESLAIAQSFQSRHPEITVIDQENKGLIGTLNHSLELANGLYYARMDADDIALPTRFEKQVDFLQYNPGHAAVGSGFILIDQNGTKAATPNLPITDQVDLSLYPPMIATLPHPTTMMRVDALKKTGGYRPFFKHAEDRDLWARLQEEGRLEILREPLLLYRKHGENITVKHNPIQQINGLLADISAVVRSLGLDDKPVLEAYLSHKDWRRALNEFAAVLDGKRDVHYMRDLYFVHRRAWDATSAGSKFGCLTKYLLKGQLSMAAFILRKWFGKTKSYKDAA
jgi:glycosyltransferase involved in cell wall biosynthesis